MAREAPILFTFTGPVVRSMVRLGMRAAFALMRWRWFVTRPHTRGASAFCLTPEGTLVLVRTSYEDGWNLPGGGLAFDEPAKTGLLRELSEELALRLFGDVIFVGQMEHRPNFKRDIEAVFVVTDAQFGRVTNLEIECVGRFTPERLPNDLSPELRQRIDLLVSHAPTLAHPAVSAIAAQLALN